jgi:hypothetical protein
MNAYLEATTKVGFVFRLVTDRPLRVLAEQEYEVTDNYEPFITAAQTSWSTS